MINSKQRSVLRGMASKLDTTLTIGKNGNTENVYKEANNLLDAHELIKVAVLQNSTKTSDEFIREFAKKLKAEPIAAIGNKFILYRKSKREDIKHIEF